MVEKEAAEIGIAPRTLFRARKELQVVSQPCGLRGEWGGDFSPSQFKCDQQSRVGFGRAMSRVLR